MSRWCWLLAISALLVLGACGADDEPGRDGAVSDAAPRADGGDPSLPEVCAWAPSRDDDCSAVSGKPLAVLCQGAPYEMITQLHCEYQSSILGAGNFYCCP